jgi:hypothetical protein
MKEIIEIKSAIDIQQKDIEHISGINSLILSVCLVDTLAGFYSGYNGQRGGNKERYLKFVDQYLPKYKDHLYDIRCNLTHSFSNTIANFMFVDNPEFSEVFPNAEKLLDWTIFNIEIFKKDLKTATEKYFFELNSSVDSTLIDNFLKRYNYRGILKDGVIPTMRNQDGKIIKTPEDMDELPGTGIKFASYDPTKTKK